VNADILLIAAAVIAFLWPQIRKLLPNGGKGPVATDADRIIAAILEALKVNPPVPLVSPTKLDRAGAMAAILSLEADLRSSGFESSAVKTAEAAAMLLVPEKTP
jgi:hypothetical protein